MEKLKNLGSIDVIGVRMHHKANHLLTICLFLMILVKKYLGISIKGITLRSLPMGKLDRENRIRSKDMKKRGYYSYVLKIFFKGRKNKMMHKEFQLKLKSPIFKSIMKNLEICLTQTKKIKLKSNLQELQYLYQVLTLSYVNPMMKF